MADLVVVLIVVVPSRLGLDLEIYLFVVVSVGEVS